MCFLSGVEQYIYPTKKEVVGNSQFVVLFLCYVQLCVKNFGEKKNKMRG